MNFHNHNQNENDFERRIEIQEGSSHEDPQHHPSSRYYVNKPGPTYYYREKRPPFFTIVIIALISALLGGLLGAYIAPTYLYGKYIPFPQPEGAAPQQNIEIITKNEVLSVIPAVAKKAMPSVVGITTTTVQRNLIFGNRRGQGVGTGVIIDNRGYILTNSHVINDGLAEEVQVLLNDGRNLVAEVLWNDALLDLAVIKIDAQNLTVADLGNSDRLTVGELAIAIGNPLGLAFERTVTSGIISGLERSIPLTEFENIEGLIQTDASINPGNSGGPLLNEKGQVIGINTAKIQSGEGLGFAIPINIAKPIVDEFIQKGEFTKVFMGIRGIGVQQYIRNYGNNLGTENGVFVYEVTPNAPVYRAGMQEGDVITAIDDKKIDTMGQLLRQLYTYRPGDVVQVAVVRGGNQITLEVTLEPMPKN